MSPPDLSIPTTIGPGKCSTAEEEEDKGPKRAFTDVREFLKEERKETLKKS